MDLLTRLKGYQYLVRHRLPLIQNLATLKVSLVLLDQTVGFGEEERPFSLGELSRRTGCSEKAVRNALHQLEREGFLVRQERPGQSSILGCRLPEKPTSSGPIRIHDSRRRGITTTIIAEKRPGATPPPEAPPTPPPEGKGSMICNKSTWEKSITSQAPQEDPLPAGELGSLAGAVSRILEGKTRRIISPPEILPTLRELKADALNRDLEVDLTRMVLGAVQYGIEANLRKNGDSTIWSWQYFLPGLRDALEKAALERQRQVEMEESRQAKAEVEAKEERILEEQTAKLRSRWESLPVEERQEIERRAFRGLPEFIRSTIRRDRELGRRGPGIIALEHACFQELSLEIAGDRQESGPETRVVTRVTTGHELTIRAA